MFLTLGLQFQAWNLEISFQNSKKHTVKCMFLTLGLQFQAWNLEISFQNCKNIHFTRKMYVFDSGASISGLES